MNRYEAEKVRSYFLVKMHECEKQAERAKADGKADKYIELYQGLAFMYSELSSQFEDEETEKMRGSPCRNSARMIKGESGAGHRKKVIVKDMK